MLFDDQLAGENFFNRLENLRARQRPHAGAGSIHMCLLLGFQVRYILEGSGKLTYLTSRLVDEIAHMKGKRSGFAPGANGCPRSGEVSMKNRLSTLVLIALAATQGSCNASDVSNVTVASRASKDASAPNVSKYATQQGWTSVKANTVRLPLNDIAPVLYTAKGDSVPSCGLLAHTAAGTEFFEMMSPEKGVGFPQCLVINDAAAFEVRNRQYLVIEYIARDTVEDFYRQYFYLYRDPAGRYIADSELNDAVVWTDPLPASRDSVNAPRAQEGIRRAKGTLLSKAVPGMRFLGREFISGKNSSFAAFHDKANEKCVFLVDAGAKPATYGHELFAKEDKCESVLASGKMENAGTTYYLALFKGAVRNHLGIVSVAPGNAIAAETSLALAIEKKGTLADLKTAKERLKSSL